MRIALFVLAFAAVFVLASPNADKKKKAIVLIWIGGVGEPRRLQGPEKKRRERPMVCSLKPYFTVVSKQLWSGYPIDPPIKVTITNTTGGEGATFDIVPEPLLVETWRQNHWGRNGAENVTVFFEKSGVKFQTALSPLDVLLVYNDTHIVQTSTKRRSGCESERYLSCTGFEASPC
ncbi:hypothetical protein PLEOSDRAFT_1082555 [Pleurotus ostreatus PC15]|uniref:Uncharacterized protein n=1 Tax=Pleurotus ostreatus (strain PC15) TaxID=1137138 RepID=A0A067P6K3_PLEO1|nr:hypothetical protein PLEOSDRAFT_1082555 [Pleurotus ostreatus PC15]